MTSIQIARASRLWSDRLRAYEVFVDGQPSGHVRNGETLSVPVAPGRHEVQLKIDWCSSQTVELTVPADGVAKVECSAPFPLAVPYYVSFGRKRWIKARAIHQ